MSPGFDSGVGSSPPFEDMHRYAVALTRLSPRKHAILPGRWAAVLRDCVLELLVMPESSFPIAVIDDDDVLREALGNLLTASRYDVELYDSAEAFLTAVAASKAKCLLVDIHLDGICGIELGRGLAAAGFRLPIIYMTGSPDAMLRARAIQAGCVAFLTKPFTPVALDEALMAAKRRSLS
jgi:CheY-like chemotaxis protein